MNNSVKQIRLHKDFVNSIFYISESLARPDYLLAETHQVAKRGGEEMYEPTSVHTASIEYGALEAVQECFGMSPPSRVTPHMMSVSSLNFLKKSVR